MSNRNKLKVLFIIQPDTKRIWAAVAEKLDSGREFRATLGLLCVAAMIKDFKDVECQLIDCSASDFGYPELHEAIKNSFTDNINRVWLHTCSLDHKNALNNYVARGMKIFKTENVII